jgi:hypothetical protein
MAFGGFFDGVGEGGSFLPIIKYDARSGRISRRDRENGENNDVDITRSFKAIFDFENVEIGWINFNTGGAPEFRVARYADGITVDKPTSEGFKRGVRFVVKLSKDCGGDVREFASNAAAFLDGAKTLMDSYEKGSKENAGKLPVVELKDSIAKTSAGGALKTTNYVPVWEITGWVKRPDDLVYTARSSSTPSASPSEGQSSSGPASTGATKVAPPAGDDDFG